MNETFHGQNRGEFMTLDEAIAHAREVAEEQRKACDLAWVWDNPDNIKKCAEEHDQLAEWLEELKTIKEEIGTDEWIMEHDRLIRNGAIDDFAYKIINLCDDGEFINRFNEFTATTILEIAEQLKESEAE